MFAIIRTGGKQYKVKAGDELSIERLEHSDRSKTIKLEPVLLVSKDGAVEIGRPVLKGAFCEAEVLGEVKGPKLISFKYIRREKSATKVGHRQKLLRVKIKSIHSS